MRQRERDRERARQIERDREIERGTEAERDTEIQRESRRGETDRQRGGKEREKEREGGRGGEYVCKCLSVCMHVYNINHVCAYTVIHV